MTNRLLYQKVVQGQGRRERYLSNLSSVKPEIQMLVSPFPRDLLVLDLDNETSAYAMALHGHTNDELEGGRDPREAVEEFLEVFGTNYILTF